MLFSLMDRLGKTGVALTTLVVVAALMTGLGVFLEGKVLPLPSSDTEELIKQTEVKSSLQVQREIAHNNPTEPSEVSLQLGRAIEAANQNETERTSKLEERITASDALIEKNNRLLDEKGRSEASASGNDKLNQFNQKLESLQSRLTELEASK
jgi:hypothetical protein